MASDSYHPPYRLIPAMFSMVEAIGEMLGRLQAGNVPVALHLRRENRIRTVQASCAIEGNTLDLEQVTAVLEGKRVLGAPHEIQEVCNAFAAYGRLSEWSPLSRDDLLTAHGVLLAGLVDRPGRFRASDVGIQRGGEIVHLAPPADRVPALIADLLAWLKTTPEHPLVASCVFHYEFEFIHPFQDGNGRLGRLWQTLILSRWNPLFALVPVESVIQDQQSDYYAALAGADQRADATSFIEFMLAAILRALRELPMGTDQENDHLTDQVRRLLLALRQGSRTAVELMTELGLSHRPTFRENYLHPAIAAGLIEMTRPDTPRARNQKYRLTSTGKRLANKEDTAHGKKE